MEVLFVVLYYNNLCYTLIMKDDAKKLGENLKKLRVKKDISQIELARILSVDRSFVSNVENGKNNPTLSTLRKIASALGVSTSELLK